MARCYVDNFHLPCLIVSFYALSSLFCVLHSSLLCLFCPSSTVSLTSPRNILPPLSMDLASLPHEIFVVVGCYLNKSELHHLSLSCSTIHKFTADDIIWYVTYYNIHKSTLYHYLHVCKYDNITISIITNLLLLSSLLSFFSFPLISPRRSMYVYDYGGLVSGELTSTWKVDIYPHNLSPSFLFSSFLYLLYTYPSSPPSSLPSPSSHLPILRVLFRRGTMHVVLLEQMTSLLSMPVRQYLSSLLFPLSSLLPSLSLLPPLSSLCNC